MKTPLTSLAALALLALAHLPGRAVTITEDFNSYTASAGDVSGLGAVPGFGTTTGGWLEGWRSASTTVSAKAKVLNTTPVNSGGNYFSGTLTANSSGTSLDSIALGKAYDVAGNSLASVSALYVNFDLRIDSINGSTMRYDVFDNNTRGTGVSLASWNFRTVNGFWNTVSGTGSTLTDTTMAFTTDTTYSFSIVVNPTNSTWTYTISNGSKSVSSTSALDFRTAGFATDTVSGSVGGRWLEVAATETSNVLSQSTTFSLDNISISTAAIPEPSTYALLSGVALLGFVLLGRRLKR